MSRFLVSVGGAATVIGAAMAIWPAWTPVWFGYVVGALGILMIGMSLAPSRPKPSYYGTPSPDKWRLNWIPGRFDRLFPVSRLTPLKHCARIAYDRTRETNAAAMAERQDGEAGAIGWYAYALVYGDDAAPLYGNRVPGTMYEIVPGEELNQLAFVEDFRALARRSDLEIVYEDLRMARADLRRQIREIRTW